MKKTALLLIFLFLSLTVFANDVNFYLNLVKNGSSSVEIKDSTLNTSLDKIVFSIPTNVEDPVNMRSSSTASFGLDWNLYANYDANGILDTSCSMNLYFVTSAEAVNNGYMLVNTENDEIGLNYNINYVSSYSYKDSQGDVELTGDINALDGKNGNTQMPSKERTLTLFEKIPLELITPIKGRAVLDLELLAPWGDVIGADGSVTGQDYHFMQGQYTGYVFIETVIY